MYVGRRRVLLQGAVSEPVTATHGMPPGCGHAVDLLHAFLLKTLQSVGRHVSVRKHVDDMVLIASGPCFAGHLCYNICLVGRVSQTPCITPVPVWPDCILQRVYSIRRGFFCVRNKQQRIAQEYRRFIRISLQSGRDILLRDIPLTLHLAAHNGQSKELKIWLRTCSGLCCIQVVEQVFNESIKAMTIA
eukprot:3065692-Amphidinium_carterae.2